MKIHTRKPTDHLFARTRPGLLPKKIFFGRLTLPSLHGIGVGGVGDVGGAHSPWLTFPVTSYGRRPATSPASERRDLRRDIAPCAENQRMNDKRMCKEPSPRITSHSLHENAWLLPFFLLSPFQLRSRLCIKKCIRPFFRQSYPEK